MMKPLREYRNWHMGFETTGNVSLDDIKLFMERWYVTVSQELEDLAIGPPEVIIHPCRTRVSLEFSMCDTL